VILAPDNKIVKRGQVHENENPEQDDEINFNT